MRGRLKIFTDEPNAFSREKSVFFSRIVGDADDQRIQKGEASCDNAYVSVVNRIERTGINSYSLYHMIILVEP